MGKFRIKGENHLSIRFRLTIPFFSFLLKVAKWLRVDGFEDGLYAVKVKGRLPEDIIGDLASKGVVYRPRDGSVQE